jgi:MATE family multidrug resistance protein
MSNTSYREILAMTWPLMFGTFIQSIVTFSDALFVSALGEINIGAFGNGSLLYIAIFMFCRGLADGSQIQIAQQDGAHQFSAIGETVAHARVSQLLISFVLFLLVILFSKPLIFSLVASEAVGQAMYEFIQIRSFGLFFAAQYMILVAFLIGIGKTRLIMTSAAFIALTNILLDYVLIHGNWGAPALKLIGAPLASSIAEGIGFVFLFLAIRYQSSFKKFQLNLRHVLSVKKHLALLNLSWPLMLQGVFSLSTWLVFFTLIENMSTADLETSHNIRYMYFLAFIPIFGFAATTKTVIGNLVGQQNGAAIFPTMGKIAILSLLFILVFFHGALLYPQTLINLVDQNPMISATVMSDSVAILRFVSGSLLLYSIVVVLYNTIAGLGRTKVAFFIEVFSIVLYLTGCYYFITVWHWSVREIWWVEYIYFGSLGVFSLLYLLIKKNKIIAHEF